MLVGAVWACFFFARNLTLSSLLSNSNSATETLKMILTLESVPIVATAHRVRSTSRMPVFTGTSHAIPSAVQTKQEQRFVHCSVK